jgi:hypothetical protein
MTDRRFNEEEVAAIFQQATEAQHARSVSYHLARG